jgi:hypothetical protein
MNNDYRFLKFFQISCLTGQGLQEFKTWLAEYCFIGECKDAEENEIR